MSKVTKKQTKQKREDDAEEDAEAGRGGVGGNVGRGCCAGDDPEYCVDCGKKVLATQQGLVCDGCGFWHHSVCQKVDDEVYNFLSDHDDNPSLLWYCRKCVATTKKMSAMMLTMYEQQQHLEEKVKDLADNFNRKLDDMTREINKKLDVKDKEQKEAGEEGQKRVEEKFDALLKQKSEVHAVSELVSSKLREDQEQQDEIRRRRMNVIIHGLKESTDADTQNRKKGEEDMIINLLHQIECDDVHVADAFRLGKQQNDPTAKPRALKLILASEEQKMKILKQAKNLKDKKDNGMNRVFIQQDLTQQQRAKRQQLVKEMQQRIKNGEKDLIIVSDRIVPRRPKTAVEGAGARA